MSHVIVQASAESKIGYQFYGGAREFWSCRNHETILSGSYEGGKTLAGLTKLHALLCKYAGSRALLVRKTYASLVHSALVTFEQKVLPFPPDHPESGVAKFGGEKPEFYDYVNGSRLVCSGFDNAAKALSAEYDFVYVNQAEELSLDQWEMLVGRATGRAGNAPYPLVMGDCNPGASTHWILKRPTLKLIEQKLENNPSLFDQETGKPTEQGIRTLAVLDSLTGIRYKRGRLGLWVSAEGQVYEEFDPSIHILEKLPEEFKRYIAGVDWGYTNPGVILVFGVDGDGRLYLVEEVYRTREIVAGVDGKDGYWVSEARRIHRQYHCPFVCDPSEPAYIETFRRAGIPARPAKNDIAPGIQAVKTRLQIAPDGKPRLMFSKYANKNIDQSLVAEHKSTGIFDEMSAYIYPKSSDGRPIKELPEDHDNHAMDVCRYVCLEEDSPKGVYLTHL